MQKIDILELRQQRAEWADMPISAIDFEEQQVYINRKKAVDLYIDGVSPQIITQKTGIARTEIYRFIRACFRIDSNQKTIGYQALIPNAKTHYSGSKLQKLFLKYPELEKLVIGNYFNDPKYTLERNMSYRTVHSKFVQECRRIGIQDYEYPLSLADKGYASLYRYLKDVESNDCTQMMSRLNPDAAQKFISVGSGASFSINAVCPYSLVQVDGHKIDLLYSVAVVNKQGEIIYMPATRVWLIAVIDVPTRAIVGYSVSTGENYTQYDVLQAFYNAVVPHRKINFNITGFEYPSGEGFPSLMLHETEWAVPDMVMFDNDTSHLAKNTQNKLLRILNTALHFGAVATPETRGIVERFFKTIESSGFHRLPGTTGSNPKDSKRNNPEKQSAKYQISLEEIFELLEYLIAEYNTSSHAALENQTPLQCMERKIRQGGLLPRKIADKDKKQIETLTYYTEERILRGNYKTGTKPYITFKGVQYQSIDAALTMKYVNMPVIIEINPRDISYIGLYSQNGEFLEKLVARGDWGRIPHTIQTREAALKRARNNKATNKHFTPDLSSYEEALKKRAQTNRRDRTKAALICTDKSLPKESKSTPSISAPLKTVSVPVNQDTKTIDTYTEEEIELLNKLSIEEAYKRGLI